MHLYSSKKIVTFMRPFTPEGSDEILPAGVYTVETIKEFLQGSLLPAYRQVTTLLHVQPKRGPKRIMEIDSKSLVALSQCIQASS